MLVICNARVSRCSRPRKLRGLGMRSFDITRQPCAPRPNRHASRTCDGIANMAAVPQRTLSWLYSVLTKVRPLASFSTVYHDHLALTASSPQDHYDPRQTYHDPNRTYHDVASALAQYPSLSPRTDVYSQFLPM